MNELAEEVALTTLFNKISEGTKTIDSRYGVEIVYKLGLVPSKEDINQFIEATKGKCTLSQLKQFSNKLKYTEHHSTDDLIEVFQTQDTEKKGIISKSDFKKLFTSVGSSLSDDEMEIIMGELCGNAEYINYGDFLKKLLNQKYDEEIK